MWNLVGWAVQKLLPARKKGTAWQANDQLPARAPGQLSVLPQASSSRGYNPLRSVSFGSDVQVQEIASGEEWNCPEQREEADLVSNPSSNAISSPGSRSSGSSCSRAARRNNAHCARICLVEDFDVNALWREASGHGEHEIRRQSRASDALLPHVVPDSEPPGVTAHRSAPL